MCGKSGTKKHCGSCGGEIVAAKDLANNTDKTQFVAQPAQNKVESRRQEPTIPAVPKPAPEQETDSGESTVKKNGTVPKKEKLRLISPLASIIIEGINGAIIGRRNGDYVNQFTRQEYVSGTHAKLDFKDGIWYITDLDSTNGTMINGRQLNAHVAYPLTDKDNLRIATVDFIVELS
jgi:pSer/pThr/pTyr-binding forkhead associated (FHA) protein